jgi:nucleoside-triphosphatase THEP1
MFFFLGFSLRRALAKGVTTTTTTMTNSRTSVERVHARSRSGLTNTCRESCVVVVCSLNSQKRARRVERILRVVEQGDARDVRRFGVRLVW